VPKKLGLENIMHPKDKKASRKALKRSRAPFVLPKSEIARAIAVNKNDFSILSTYAKQLNIPTTTMLGNGIGNYADCKLNNHDQKTKDLQDLVRLLRLILRKCINKFGEIPLQ